MIVMYRANTSQHFSGKGRLILAKIVAMHVVLSLDYSSFTEDVLSGTHAIIQAFKSYEISVIHVIDETLFAAGGYEVQLNEELKKDGAHLKRMCIEYLGEKVHYIEAYGIPRQKIDELLANMQYDILVIGSRSRSLLGARLLGGVAEHLLRTSTKPVLVIK